MHSIALQQRLLLPEHDNSMHRLPTHLHHTQTAETVIHTSTRLPHDRSLGGTVLYCTLVLLYCTAPGTCTALYCTHALYCSAAVLHCSAAVLRQELVQVQLCKVLWAHRLNRLD
jgi:hypothetical protein